MLLPVLVPVVRVLFPPMPRALTTPFEVVRIGGDLPSAVVGASLSLAVRFAADDLLALALRWAEDPAAVRTTPFDHTGVVALKIPQLRKI